MIGHIPGSPEEKQEKINDAAYHGAQFLRSLPDDVDAYQVLKRMGDVLGDDIPSAIMMEILEPGRGEKLYVCQSLPHAERKIINAIKEVRMATRLGLKEAKDFVEGTVPQKLNADAARALHNEIHQYGFKVGRFYGDG